MRPELALVLLFSVATAVALVTRRLKIPYTVALVVAGLALGATRLVDGVHLTKELLYAVFLPGLLFEAAYHLKFSEFRENARAILALAVPGVVAAIAATSSLLIATSSAAAFAPSFGWPHAIVFSALIAATDPIAVVALFRTLGAPKRLTVLVEGESLVNDGTSIVLFTIAYAAVTGGGTSAGDGVLEFGKVVGGGVVVGAVIGLAVTQIIKRVDEPTIEITATTIAAYGSFVAAESFNFSGVIATVTAGMFCGSITARAMSPTTRIAVESFWEYLAFAFNSLVFLLIGIEVPVGRLLDAWRPIVVAFFAVTIGRAAIVALVSVLLRPTKERLPWRWSVMLTWGGLRGALSMVLALALPAEFPHRELVVTMTFGVVLLSILIQGITSGPMLRALGLAKQRTDGDASGAQRAELLVTQAAMEALRDLDQRHLAQAELIEEVRAEYAKREQAAVAAMKRTYGEDPRVREDELRAIRRRLLEVERNAVRDAYGKGILDEDERNARVRDIDARIASLGE